MGSSETKTKDNVVEEKPTRLDIKMEENDQLTLKAMLYKIQLEQERVKNAQLTVANAQLCEQMASQELKMWEATYKMRLAANKYEIKGLEIDADTGKVSMMVLPKRNIDGTRPKTPIKTNGKLNGKGEHRAGA